MRARFCIGALWLLMAWGTVWAQSPGEPLTIGKGERYELSRHFEYLEDAGGQLTLDQILQSERQAAFRPLAQSGSGANFGLTASAIWLRVRLMTPAQGPADWLLEVAFAPLNRIDLYMPDSAGGFTQHRGGSTLPFESRALAHRHHVLPVKLVPGGETVLYLRAQSQGTVTVPATLWQPAALWRHDQAAYAALSLYFGLLIGLLLYNLLLFASVRDRGYLIYAASWRPWALRRHRSPASVRSSFGRNGRRGT